MENAKFDPIIKSRSTTADQLEALYNHEELTIEQIAKVIRHPNVDIDFVEELLIFEREEDYQVIMAITGKAARLSREAVEKLMYIIIYNHPHEWSKEDLKKLENLRKQKTQIIRVLSVLSDHEWVVSILNKYVADKDDNIQYEAKKALEKTRENAVRDQQMREEYKKRKKD
jgi:hypothetical protein